MKAKVILLTLFLLLITGNSYSQWIFQNSSDQSVLKKVFLFDNTGYITSNNKVQKTTNAGSQWIMIREFESISASYFLNSLTGYVMTAYYDSLYRTTNGGQSWNLITNFFTPYADYQSILFINGSTGFIGGSGHFQTANWIYINKTTNAGINWNVYSASGDTPIRSMHFDGTNMYAVGDGRSLKTTNLGDSWDAMSLTTMLTSVWFINQNTGFVAAADIGSVFKTTNGGLNWAGYNLSTGNVNSIFFTGDNTGYLSADEGKIFRTTDLGISWGSLVTNTVKPLHCIYFADNNTGYSVGGTTNEAVIIKTTNGGGNTISIQIINSEIPNSFNLLQNYPNPFNPATKIKFDVPKASLTKLIIYDMLGREVAALVNEELKAGTYEADWNASAFSSGVYFFKIISGDFVETKKMVLMK